MKTLWQLLSKLGGLSAPLGKAVAWLTFAMVLGTMAVVVIRYVLDDGSIMLQESVMYMHAFVLMLAIPYALLDDAHVRVDILYSRLTPAGRDRVNLLGHLVFLLPVAAFIVYSSLTYVGNSWRILEGSPEVGGIPGVFILKTLIPVTGVLLFLEGVADIGRIRLRQLERD